MCGWGGEWSTGDGRGAWEDGRWMGSWCADGQVDTCHFSQGSVMIFGVAQGPGLCLFCPGVSDAWLAMTHWVNAYGTLGGQCW